MLSGIYRCNAGSLSTVEKVHVLCVHEMNRGLYTGENFEQNIEKICNKLVTLFAIIICILLFLQIYSEFTARLTEGFASKILIIRKLDCILSKVRLFSILAHLSRLLMVSL